MGFQWDEEKSAANAVKHGISFLQAAQIFRGRLLTRPDDRKDYGEQRFIALGAFDGVVLRVVFTERDGDIRLISAWRAGKHDRKTPKLVRFGSVDELPSAPPLSKAVKAMGDDEIERRAAADPDAGPIPDGFWDTAEVREPEGTEQITLRLPRRVLNHFKSTGKGYQSRISAVLSSYVDATTKRKAG
jgi:uncharacterized protein